MTIADIIAECRRRARDFPEHGTSSHSVKPRQRRFHTGRRFIVPGSFTCLIEDETLGWTPISPQPTLDPESGWFVFPEDADIDGALLACDFSYYRRFSDHMAYAWLNAGINELWPEFYLLDYIELPLQTNVSEYSWPEGAYNVLNVEVKSPGGAYRQSTSWDHAAAESKIKFYRPPGSGTMRVTYQLRFSGTVSIEDQDATLRELLGLPPEAENAIILYLEYSVARAAELERVATNVSVNYEPTSARFSDLSQATRDLYTAFVTYKRSVAMPPPEMSMRVPV